jgi:hypothetical protein
LNIGDVTATCPSYPSMIAITSQYYLLSYADKTTQQSTLQLISVTDSTSSSASTSTVVYQLQSSYYIYELQLLDNTSGLFVAICQDSSDTEETAFVVLGVVNPALQTVTLYPSSAVQYATIYSIAPTLITLSSTSFLIGYYAEDETNNNIYTVMLKYGKIMITVPYMGYLLFLDLDN